MKRTLYLLMLVLSASVCSAQNAVSVSYMAGAFAFEELSNADVADLDQLKVHARAGQSIALKFSRSRGVADVVDFTQQGNLRLAGKGILWPDGHMVPTQQDHWSLSEDISVQASPSTLILYSQRSSCDSIAPIGFAFEHLSTGQLPRSMAASGQYLFAILESQRQEGHPQILLPVRVSLTTCQSSLGAQFESPGFDYRLQVRGERALLASRAESAVLLSNDGLVWKREDLPAPTHTLLAADITPGGIQVAVSRADRDFALGFFSKTESNSAVWQEDSDIRLKPMTWLEGAREAAMSATSLEKSW